MDRRAVRAPPRRPRLPRAGGDGPCATSCGSSECAAPPRRRGWTHEHSADGADPRGSPAQAGMDLRSIDDVERIARLPRAGGDGPARSAANATRHGAPPRRRGWTRARACRWSRGAGSPAQAGMDPRGAGAARCPKRLPRAGGDGPSLTDNTILRTWAPPRRRGWTFASDRQGPRVYGSPAQAGMDPPRGWTRRRGSWLPRAGGDGPASTSAAMRSARAPPRRRGWTHVEDRDEGRAVGSPAQAGMDPLPSP